MIKRNVSLAAGLSCAMSLAICPDVYADEELEWDEAELFFELNDTDGDLGLHANIDGEPWKWLEIESARGRTILNIRARYGLRRQGMTQLAWESAEPPFDELDPADFFRRFPEGIYEISGMTLEGEEVESEVEISHVLAAPPGNITVNGQTAADSCDSPMLPAVTTPVVVDWDPVTESHPEIGMAGVDVEIARYQFFVERDEVKLGVDLSPDVTGFAIPDAFLDDIGVWKYEIIARTEGGNNTAVETCFILQ